MVLREYPKEVRKWRQEFKPYRVNGKFIKGTPQSAYDAFEKFREWMWNLPQ